MQRQALQQPAEPDTRGHDLAHLLDSLHRKNLHKTPRFSALNEEILNAIPIPLLTLLNLVLLSPLTLPIANFTLNGLLKLKPKNGMLKFAHVFALFMVYISFVFAFPLLVYGITRRLVDKLANRLLTPLDVRTRTRIAKKMLSDLFKEIVHLHRNKRQTRLLVNNGLAVKDSYGNIDLKYLCSLPESVGHPEHIIVSPVSVTVETESGSITRVCDSECIDQHLKSWSAGADVGATSQVCPDVDPDQKSDDGLVRVHLSEVGLFRNAITKGRDMTCTTSEKLENDHLQYVEELERAVERAPRIKY